MKNNLLKSVILSVILLMGVSNAWANTNFTKGEVLFIYTDNGDAAWTSGACVKLWFNNDGTDKGVANTQWLSDYDDNHKLFYAIVPGDGANKVQLQRFSSDCSTWWNSCGNALQSSRQNDAYNTFYSTGAGNSDFGWKNETFEMYLYGAPNNWASSLGTFVHQGNGVYKYTYRYKTTATSLEFKLADSKGKWHGNNVSTTGLTKGKTYDLTGTVNLANGMTLTMAKSVVSFPVTFASKGTSGTSEVIAKIGSTTLTSGDNYESGQGVVFTASPATGYEIEGWYSNAACTSSLNNGKNMTYTINSLDAAVQVYVKFIPKTYTVTLNYNDGTERSEEVEVTYDSEMPSITPPKREGYTFGGYWTGANGEGTQYYSQNGTAFYNKKWDIADNKTLYAKWTAHEYTVHFNANGGEGTMEDQSFTYDVEKVLSPNSFNRTGYTFAGWATSAKGSVVYGDQQPVKNLSAAKNGNITLYAQWTPNTYTVQFNANGGEGSMDNQEFIYDETKNLSKNIFSKEGCIFTGWNTAADRSGTSYTDQQSVSNLVTEGTITLYAQWSTANCKWLETDIANIESDDKVVVTMSKEGYIYAMSNNMGAGAAPAASSISVKDGVISEEVKDYNEWTIVKEGNYLTFYADATNRLFGNKADDGLRVGSKNNATTNHEFYISGSYLVNKVTSRYVGVHLTKEEWFCYETNTGNIKDQTLRFYKKVCLPDNEYWVTWDAGEGLFEDGKSTKIEHYQVGAEITPPTPIRRGYNFTWNTIPENTMPAQNITYTALWTLKTTTITLSPQGGTGGTEFVKATYSQNMPEITPPTRTGYNFQGYFSSNGGTGTKYYNADGTSATAWDREDENFPLIAYWTAKTTTVSFDQNGGTGGQTSTVTATYDEAMPTITVPTKEGHTFLGYYDATTDGTQYYDAAGNSTQKWNKEDATFTLYAQWKVNQYTVTWNANEGNWHGQTENKVDTYDYGATIKEPEDPVRGGWVFNGWDPTPATTMPANDLEYTAQWGKAYCENRYTFHTGTSEVWNNPTIQHCFERKEGTETEWQILDYVIPEGNDHTHFLVAYSGWPQRDQGSLGRNSKSFTSTWSSSMYLAPAMNFESGENTPKVGHAAGAKGTLRIFDDSSWDNLCVGFIPNGYGITITGETVSASHAFHKTTTANKWETDVVKLPGVTNHKYAMGLTAIEGTFVACDHSKAAENIQNMGVTDKVVYLVVNDNWKVDNARFAVCFMNSDKSVQTWVDMNKIQLQYATKDLYVATVPADQKYVIFCRMNGATTDNNWDNRWTQTDDVELPTDGLAIVCTISNWTDFAITKATPQTQQNGKFRMWDNSNNKNWYVHFVPYYLLSYDKNGGEREMAPTEYNTEDADNKVTVAACRFTRTGYDFVSWNTAANGSGTSYNAGATYTMTQDAKLYAQWQAQTYDITYRDQGGVDFSGTHGNNYPTTHTYDKATSLVSPTRVGYTFDGWYTTPACDGEPITQLGATEYTTDITLYAKWTFAMEYNITNTEIIFITSAEGQTIKATQPLILKVSNMPVGTTIDLSAGEHIHFYYANKEIKQLTNKSVDETFELEIAYKPEASNTTEKPSITLNVLGHEKVLTDRISCRSLPNTFAVVAKVGGIWYALPSQGLNSTTPPAAYPVEVDNMADPTAVTAVPANADWSLRQVYEAIRVDATKDRFVENGENFVFVNNEGTPKAINASVSGNYLLTDAQYSGYYETNPGLYEWTPTTSDLETYTLTNAQRTERTLNVSINTVFGVHYDNKATTEVRFLPIENRYTPLALQVVEWKEKSVVVMYNGDPVQTASVSVNGGSVQTTELSGDGVQKDIAVYELTADGLATNPTQSLSITIGTEKAILPIPYIVSGDLDDATLLGGNELTIARRQEIAKISDLVILNGGSITAERISTNYYKFRNVTIYGGGSLIIPADKGFGANTLTMRVGGVENREYVYTYPQLDLNGTINSGNINLDLMTTYDYYYPFSVPYEVTLSDIHYPTEIYGSNVNSNNTGSFLVSYYDGAERALGKTGWRDVEEQKITTLSPHVGYSIWGLPKKVSVNGATSVRQTYGIHRIPMKKAADVVMSNETTNKNVDIFAHNATRDNDKGWNFIGNPYLVQHGGLDGSDTDVYMGLLVKEMKDGQWTGGWVFNGEQVRYVTQTNDCLNYTSTPVANATIPAFSAFFIQAKETGAIAFTSPNVAAAQSLAARCSDENKEITTGIILSGEKHSDRTGLLIADKFTEAYEFNADLSKFDNQDMNLYTIAPSGKLAFMAINEELAKQTIPLGYSVSADGMYTIAFDEQRYNRNDIYALYLIDYDRNETTNLLQTDYNFYSELGAHVERFALQVAFAQKTPTDVEYTQVGNVLVSREGNTLRLDNLPSNATVTIYDAVGHLIEQHSPSQHLQVNLPTGYYLMHIANKQDAVVIDTFIP